MSEPHHPVGVMTERIWYGGQGIALVVAETLEAAIDGAERATAVYAEEPFVASMDSPDAERDAGEASTLGDAEAALATASVRGRGRI